MKQRGKMMPFKSNKQRRTKIMAARRERTALRQARNRTPEMCAPRPSLSRTMVPVDVSALAEYNSYGAPEFVYRACYEDQPFRCKDCDKEEIWPAERQKWWYEVAKGDPYSTAIRCKACRAKERARKAAARLAAGHIKTELK